LNESRLFFVYLLQNAAGRFYIGSTDDLTRRVHEHNDPDNHSTYTGKNGPWTLVWSEPHPTRAAAMKREKQIKAMKSALWIRRHLLNELAS
jgi:putative endonuclease